jgi:hypothetical protein
MLAAQDPPPSIAAPYELKSEVAVPVAANMSGVRFLIVSRRRKWPKKDWHVPDVEANIEVAPTLHCN